MNRKPMQVLFEAMYHGKYDFMDFAEGDVASNFQVVDLKERRVYSPNKRLKAYHAFLNLFLFEYLKFNERVVFSYRKGVNAHDAVAKHSKSKSFFQTDICNFFTSLDSELIKKTIRESIDRSPISDASDFMDRIIDLVTIDDSLPMGFSTSPLISNACLFLFDNTLESACHERDLIYTRYSDDIIISSASKSELSDIDVLVATTLEACFDGKLRPNTVKSKFTRVGNKIKLLGMVILPNGKVTVDIKLKSKIEVLIYFYINDRKKFIDTAGGNIGVAIDRVSGYLNYVNTVDKSYLDKLRKKFGATVVDTFLHHSAE